MGGPRSSRFFLRADRGAMAWYVESKLLYDQHLCLKSSLKFIHPARQLHCRGHQMMTIVRNSLTVEVISYIYFIYGSKPAGWQKSDLNVLTSPSIKETPCPNHPSYRLQAFTQLDIYVWGTCTRIFTSLGSFLRA